MRFATSLFLALSASLVGCGSPLDSPPVPSRDAGFDLGAHDAGSPDAPDVVVPVDTGPPPVDSGCPAPRAVTPADATAGFLAPSTVFYIRDVDGDTAHFRLTGVDLTVRFLWVNTEESHAQNPADDTAFGVLTGDVVAGYLAAGHEFVLVREASTTNTTMPSLDAYGRTLSLVFVDGTLFQERLVREGYSAYYTEFGCAPEPIHSALLDAEAEARANHRGIWAPGHPTNYQEVFSRWIGSSAHACRPNPYRNQSYCP